jgi:hypothetical protein
MNSQNKAQLATIAGLSNSQARADIELIIAVDHT